MQFTAPTAGYYSLAARTVMAVPTGKFETIKNPKRRFYEFWKSKFITREIFRYEEKWNGRQIRFLEQGEIIECGDALATDSFSAYRVQ